ncbi:MAG: murein L,D-transpeptidase [Acidimicrobiia bacterium]|nr:murein L,D-transpeptidase [Acidimicrobiia bacterium]
MSDRSEDRRSSKHIVVAMATVMAVAITVVVGTGWLGRDASPAPVAAPPTTIPPTTATTTTVAPTEVPATTALASPNGEIATYSAANGPALATVGFWYGYPMTMPIVEEQGDWLRIMLPDRPNMSTAWVRAADVTRSVSNFRIVVRLSETRLIAYQDGYEIFSAPVGIGKDSTPTAPGNFFVAVVTAPGPAGYGPVVLDTSGHSEAIRSWQGSGDAVTSIHGSVSASSAAKIGTTGTKISNGCIRMLEADQRKLAVIPLGTPVDIIL